MDTLSQHLLSHVNELKTQDESGKSPDELKLHCKQVELADKIADALVLSRMKLTSADLGEIEAFVNHNHELTIELLDEKFTIEFLRSMDERVDRVMRLAQLKAVVTPSQQTNRYIEEASRAYVAGLYQSCLAMCRAALEQALKEKLGRQGSEDFIKFDELVKDAAKWLKMPSTSFSAVRDVAKKCNKVLHDSPANRQDACNVFGGVRSLLEEIYSADCAY